MKYIIHKSLGPILFPSRVDHIDIAKYLGGKEHVVSAGHFHGFFENATAHSESMTLNISSRPEDTEIIKEAFCS